ncbi:MAG: hypothetical protein QOK27_2175 [Gemmatimonadales bacterium]|nr:hypothetical protein [Gemmatimonadales bacterium]
MARNAYGFALLVTLALAGCSAFSNKKEEQAAMADQAKLATIRARTDSLRKARHLADSLAQVRQVACVDSVRIELGKAAAFKPKTKSRRKQPKTAAPSEEMILTQAQSVCGQETMAPQTTVAAAQPAARDTAHAVVAADSMKPAAATAAPAQPEAVVASNDSVVWADSVRKAKEIEMSRETFSYGGAARDPFNSLFNMAKNGPELADLQLVGIYQNLRTPSSSVAVFREKEGGKRHKLRAGDQVGRSRLVQIRDRDVVFMIEDFGFERQETLSLRKQEDVIQ